MELFQRTIAPSIGLHEKFFVFSHNQLKSSFRQKPSDEPSYERSSFFNFIENFKKKII